MAGVGVAVVAVSTSAILIEASSAPPTVQAFYRVLFTAGLLAPLLPAYRADLERLSRRDAAAAVATGVALAAHFASWFASLSFTTVAAATTLVQTQVVFVAIAGWLLLGEVMTRRKAAGVAVAFAGAALMSVDGLRGGGALAAEALLGDALAVVGALGGSAYVLAGRSLRQRIALVPYVLVVYLVCAVILGAGITAAGLPFGGYPAHEWGLFLAMAIGPGVLGHTLINWALKHVESGVVSVWLLGEPVGSTALALVLFAQVPGPFTVVGGAVVLVGIYVTATVRT
ncbi:MAG: DMT family transporter [Halobacteriaceae archaeon]